MAAPGDHATPPDRGPWLELPLAIASFCAFRAVKLAVTQLLRLQAARFNRDGFRWSVLCGEAIRSPLTLAIPMTKGPRWNPHALIASAGPFRAETALAINRRQADAASGSWTMVIYRYPSIETAALLTSTSKESGEWLSQPVPPGRYTLGLRYYDPHPPARLPAARVDGRDVLPALTAPSEPNGFYATLAQRTNWFYTALHFHVLTMLRWADRLPAGFVRAQYLPVGDPGTFFDYGPIAPGQALTCEFAANLLQDYRLYFTQYNRASFPVFWTEMTASPFVTPPAAAAGYYLVRLRPHRPSLTPGPTPTVRLQVRAAPSA